MRRVLFLVAAAALVSGCGSGDGTFDEDGFGITFDYPKEMKTAKNVNLSQSAGSAAKATAGVGFSKKDVLLVQRFDLNLPIDEDNLDRAQSEFDRLVQQISPGAGSGKTGKTGDFPSITYDDITVQRFKGAKTRLVALFDGDTEYLINCQYTPERKKDVLDACDQALDSVKKS